MKKRILSLLLAVLMIGSVLNLPAYAENDGSPAQEPALAQADSDPLPEAPAPAEEASPAPVKQAEPAPAAEALPAPAEEAAPAPVTAAAPAPVYATVDEFNAAIAEMGDATDEESTRAVIAKCLDVYSRLSPEDQAAQAEAYAYIQAYAQDFGMSGIENMRYDYSIDGDYEVPFRGKVNGSYQNLAYAFVPCGGKTVSLWYEWNSSRNGWELKYTADSGVRVQLYYSFVKNSDMSGMSWSYTSPATGNGSRPAVSCYSGGTPVSNISKLKVTIQYVDEATGDIVGTGSYTPTEYGTHTVKGTAPSGWTIVGDTSKSVTTTKDSSTPNPVQFTVKKTVTTADYTVTWVDTLGNTLKAPETRKGTVGEKVSATAEDKTINSYEYQSGQSTASATLKASGTELTLVFKPKAPGYGEMQNAGLQVRYKCQDLSLHGGFWQGDYGPDGAFEKGSVTEENGKYCFDLTVKKDYWSEYFLERLSKNYPNVTHTLVTENDIVVKFTWNLEANKWELTSEDPVFWFKGSPITYRWLDADGNVINSATRTQSACLPAPGFEGELPQKPEDDNNTYEFDKWSDPEVDDENGTVTYKPEYKAIPKVDQVTVTWMDGYSSTPIKTVTVAKDITDEDLNKLYPDEPTRHGYVFVGWEAVRDTTTGNITITAKWKADCVNIP